MTLFKHRRSAERDAFSVPRSVQKFIPIKRIYQDGVFQVSGKFSKTWRFFDVNYAVASPEKQRELFMTYCSFLNSLPIGATAKITLFNRQLNQKDFGRTLLMPMQGDRCDLYRNEYNALVLGKAAESNNLIQEKYITVSAEKKSVEEARAFFSRVGTDLTTGLSRMSSSVREITVNDRLRLLHDFYRPGEEQLFRFDLEDTIRKGHDFRDSIAPDCISFQKNHYELGDHVGRTLFLREYASFISDAMITELMDYPRNMMLSIDIIPVAMDEAVSDIRKRIMSVESDITRWQQRQNQNNNFTANIPYDLEQMRSETKEFMDDLMSRDQRMMLALVTLTHLADNLEQLDQDTEALQAIGRARGCQFNILRYQQEDALNTVLPLGLKRIDATRTLTTECTAVLMPFKSQEIQDAGGIYYGVNAVSHNLIVCNRGNLLNGNGFITGVSGSGKSSLVNEILYKHLANMLNGAKKRPGKFDRMTGVDNLDKVINIDQSPIGRTPRSNPATYTGVFNDIRDLFASTPDAKMRGYKANRFSFNVKGGRCEACQGDGIVKIEMHFLADVYVPCDVCGGHRYNRETLEVKFKGKNIYEVLEMTVDEGVAFFAQQPKILRKLQTLSDVGLGYVKIGQPATTLSGGEAQRVKLATELMKRPTGKTIYILDEPTTGLHTADVHRLVNVLERLVANGNTVVVIEHNLDVIKTADYIIDLGPEGGVGGGTLVACGTPEEIAACPASYTGQYLKSVLDND